jgi:crossover junction endodeoxyribonuclease RuvC
MRRILGIDPGSIKTGWGVIEIEESRVSYIDSGILQLGDGTMVQRLVVLYEGLQNVIRQYQPTEAAIEEVFLAKNFQSALKLGQARGVAMLSAGQAAILTREFAAKSVKQAVCGQGQASKSQMQSMVIKLLGLAENPGEDAADALGIALCAAYTKDGLQADARFRLSSRSRGRGRARWRLGEDQ